jgi:hypothetical protein
VSRTPVVLPFSTLIASWATPTPRLPARTP